MYVLCTPCDSEIRLWAVSEEDVEDAPRSNWQDATEPDPNSLLCRECAFRDGKSDHKCLTHGVTKAIFKCDCCCAVATYDCSGNHYCDRCHSSPSDKVVCRPECRGRVEDECQLSMLHPPNQARDHSVAKTGFVIGCTVCFEIDQFCTLATPSQSASRF